MKQDFCKSVLWSQSLVTDGWFMSSTLGSVSSPPVSSKFDPRMWLGWCFSMDHPIIRVQINNRVLTTDAFLQVLGYSFTGKEVCATSQENSGGKSAKKCQYRSLTKNIKLMVGDVGEVWIKTRHCF